MKREINIDQGIIDGDSKRFLEAHFNSDVISFRQRKSYDEYYWDSYNKVAEFDELILDELSKFFSNVTINSVEVLISE